MAKHLEGKSAVVTGAGRGIGRGIALALAEQGAKVIVADFGGSVEGSGTDKGVADQVVDEIKAAGGIAEADYCDVADHVQAENLIRHSLDSFGGLDILINVAGNLRDRMMRQVPDRGGQTRGYTVRNADALSYSTGGVQGVNDLRDLVAYSARASAHLNADGLCAVRPSGAFRF